MKKYNLKFRILREYKHGERRQNTAINTVLEGKFIEEKQINYETVVGKNFILTIPQHNKNLCTIISMFAKNIFKETLKSAKVIDKNVKQVN